MGGCFSKHSRQPSATVQQVDGLPMNGEMNKCLDDDNKGAEKSSEPKMVDEGRPRASSGDSLGEKVYVDPSKHSDIDQIQLERRRLSVSHSAGCEDDTDDPVRGTFTVFQSDELTQDAVRTLLSPTNSEKKAEITHVNESRNTLSQPNPQRRRLSISGCLPANIEENFENKKLEMKGSTGASNLEKMGIGYACKKGLKPESPNQDDFFIVRIDNWGLYGVFDGHGPFGHDVSNFVQRELPRLIYDNIYFWTDPLQALQMSFIKVHDMLIQSCQQEGFDCSLSGTTASVILHRPDDQKLYVAHVGDSRCVLGRVRKNGSGLDAIDLTNDHKPNNEAELKRIIASGGQVKRLEGDIPHRVFLKGKLYPGLAMSRAIGDVIGTQAGVICTPETRAIDLDTDADVVLTMCSDGVWEFISSQEAIDIISTCGRQEVQHAAELIARESWQRWIKEEGNVVDDITAEVIFLHEDGPVKSL